VVAPRSACLCCSACIGTVVIEFNIVHPYHAVVITVKVVSLQVFLPSACLLVWVWARVLGLNASIVRLEQAMMFRRTVCNYSTICLHSGRELPTAVWVMLVDDRSLSCDPSIPRFVLSTSRWMLCRIHVHAA